MNLINTIKSFFYGFKKEGDKMDNTADLSKLDTAASGTMQSATRQWWDAFQRVLPQEPTHNNFRPLPMAYVSSAYLAQLVTGEIKYQLADERSTAMLRKICFRISTE